MHGVNGLITTAQRNPRLFPWSLLCRRRQAGVLQAITYGAVGFIQIVPKGRKLTKAIEQIMAGNVYLPSELIRSTAL